MADVSLRSIGKSYGSVRVIDGLDLAVADGEFVALVGPSGCGKSTTLRMIAGLEEISAGELRIGGRVVNNDSAKQRDIAMVFQDYALYPHMNVRENMAFGLRVRSVPRNEIESRIKEASAILGIESLLGRMPRELSGGQRQRVAMGRAIVRKPKVFLFDEPLSNLDAKLRLQMRTEIKRLHQRLATTMIYVTHDQVEAMTLADRVVVMQSGVIEQEGSPDEVYNHPRSMFVGGFVGSPPMNFVPAILDEEGKRFRFVGADMKSALPARDRVKDPLAKGKDVILGIRPEHIRLAEEADGHATVRVDVVEPLGSDTLVHFNLGKENAIARIAPDGRVRAGEFLHIRLDLDRIHYFDPTSGQAYA